MRTVCGQRIRKALFIRHLRWKHAVHFVAACDFFHIPDSNCYLFIFLCVDCASFMCDWANLGLRKHNEFRACALLVPRVSLALVWRSSGVYIHTWKNATFFNIQKVYAEVDAHDKWITFIRRSRQIINEFWRTPSESQRTDQHSPLCTLDVRDGMCDWAFTKTGLLAWYCSIPMSKWDCS